MSSIYSIYYNILQSNVLKTTIPHHMRVTAALLMMKFAGYQPYFRTYETRKIKAITKVLSILDLVKSGILHVKIYYKPC